MDNDVRIPNRPMTFCDDVSGVLNAGISELEIRTTLKT